MILALAPMQDVTDLAMLNTLKRLGSLPDYFITEYFRVSPHLRRLDPFILRSIEENPTGVPIWGQLVGSDRETLVINAQRLLKTSAAGVDLNIGCPAPLVCRKQAGAGMLRLLPQLRDTLSALRDAIPEGQFSVKCRIGWDAPDEWEELLPLLAENPPDRLAIHARTASEKYRSPVHLDAVAQAVKALPCPVIANGNMVDIETIDIWVQTVKPAGLMIGRGAIRNPWLFLQTRAYLAKLPIPQFTQRDLLHYIHCLYEESLLLMNPYVEAAHIHRLKKFLVYIAQGLNEEFNYSVRRVDTAQGFLSLCSEHLDNDKPLEPRPPQGSRIFAHFEDLLTSSIDKV